MATITVLDATDNAPLWLAHVFKFSTGQGAVTDMDGVATIPDDEIVGQWAISHVGFSSATLNITEPSSAVVRLNRGVDLPEIVITPPNEPPPTWPPNNGNGGTTTNGTSNYWLWLALGALLLIVKKK